MKVRTRYAPSPTGFLHIGGARTALFTYLYAKAYKGTFIIRIEDTDIERNVEGGEASQIDNLEWIGVIADESPRKENAKYGKYRQSERLDSYNKYVEMLLEKDLAYEAFDTPEEILKQKEESVKKGQISFRYDRNWLKLTDEEKQKRRDNNQVSIRLKLPENVIYEWEDQVRGNIKYNSDEISEFVIRKSNGIPTYSFANVIDDHLMDITHVHRGEEHIANTPKQLAVYDYFGWTPPIFGHFTIITNLEGKKLSKRDTSLKQFIEQYREEGYHPHAIFNFLSLLGWSHPQAKEILSKEEIINSFSVDRMSKSPSKFDIKKMQWLSNKYISKMSDDEYLKQAIKFINIDLSKKDQKWIDLLLTIYKPQIYSFFELNELIKPYFELPNINSEDKKLIASNDSLSVVKDFFSNLKNSDFTIDNIKEAINKTKDNTGFKGKDLFMPIRVATTYQSHGPELAKAIYLYGKELVIKRIEECLK